MTAAGQARHESDEEHAHRHDLGAFLGATSSEHGSGATVGVEYEFRLHRHFGLGVTGETVGGDINENVAAFLAYFHPTERFAVFGGGGWDRRLGLAEEAASAHGAEPSGESRGREPLGRFGVLYEFPLGKRFAASPNVSLDFVEGTTIVVYGVTIGLKF